MSERSEDNKDPVLVHLSYIKDAVDGVNARLDILNGRQRTAEQDIAVLKDRSEEAKTTSRNQGAVWGSIAGGVMTGALWVWQTLSGGGR